MEVPKPLQSEPGNLAAELQTWRQKCEHQATLISRLGEENDSLRSERKTYMDKLKEKRGELASLQGKLDDAASEVADLKRALIRAQDAASQHHHDTPQRPGPQIPLTPPPSASVKPHLTITAEDDEIQYLGSSSPGDMSELDPTQHTEANNPTPPKGVTVKTLKRQPTPRMVAFVSLPPRSSKVKHMLERTEPKETQTTETPTDDSIRSPKRRKVEAATLIEHVRDPGYKFKTPLPRQPAGMNVASRVEILPATANTNTSPITTPSGSSRPRIRLTLLPPKDQSKPEAKPKLKIEAFIVPPLIVSEHLNSCKSLYISPRPHEVYVPRRFIRATYGGNDRLLVQKIKPHRNPSGHTERRLMFPMFDMNPSMPSKPGEPGLMYGSRLDLTKESPHSLFSSDLRSKKAVWMYLGEYESTRCATMSASLFKSQRPEVKKAWGTQIRDGKQWDIYVAMRARIALRKAKLGVAVDKVSEEMAKIKNNNGRSVSVEDIVAAFESGAEGVDIIKMQCVAYDHTFANNLETNINVWNTPAARTQRQLLKGRRRALRGHRNTDGTGAPGGDTSPGQHTDLETHNPRTQNIRDSAIRVGNHSAPNGEEIGDSFDDAFDSDLTEYDYASSLSVEY